MDYRDERDALRARVESLEGEIASARADLVRLGEVEKALAAVRRENERLRGEVKRLAPAAPGDGRGRKMPVEVKVAIASVVVVATVGSVGLLVGLRAQNVEAPVEPASAPQVAPSKPSQGKPSSERRAEARWAARVGKAQGIPFAEGTPCLIAATLRSDGQVVSMPDVEVSCEGKTLYSSKDPLEGTSSRAFSVEELPGPADKTYRWALAFDDQGVRSGRRAQASVNTIAGVAIVWQDTAPPYRVEMVVD